MTTGSYEHPRSVVEVKQRTLQSFLSRHSHVILFYEPDEAFSRAIIEHFNAKYPGEYGFCVLAKDDVAYDPWWTAIVEKVVADKTYREFPPRGYYLFANGDAVAYAKAAYPADASTLVAGIAKLAVLAISKYPPPVDTRKVDKERAAAVIKHFDCWIFRDGVKARLARRGEERLATDEAKSNFVPRIQPLSASAYSDVLSRIRGVGVQMERHPATYKGKNEEDIRDHILTFLSGHVAGSWTGEAFNKSGKTDILLCHGDTPTLVVECKFWSGASAHKEHVSQLLRYLTWRDTKAALLVFCTRKDVTAVVAKARAATLKHPRCVAEQDTASGDWFTFEFSLPDAQDARIQVSLIVFHFPK